MKKITFIIAFLTLLAGCGGNEPIKPDILQQLKFEDSAKSSHPIPPNFPADIPIYPAFVAIKDSGEFGGSDYDGKRYIEPIIWAQVADIAHLEDAKNFYKKQLLRTRYSAYVTHEVGRPEAPNMQLEITFSKDEFFKMNFINNYLGVPAVRIDYHKKL